MEPVTVSLTEEQLELIEELSAEDGPCKNRSEAMRMIIDQYNETKELEKENERLKRQLIATNKRVEEHTELVEYVEEERSWRSAGLGTRIKWWVFGRDE